MAHYTLFIPNGFGNQDERLRQIGLQQLVSRHNWQWVDILENGPGQQAGAYGRVMSSDETKNPIPTIDFDRQTWVQSTPIPEFEVPAGAFWFGFEPERPPRPEDLAYAEQYDGAKVKLKDGNNWLVPESMQLPTTIGRSPETGELTRFYAEEFEEFCQQAENFAFMLIEAQMTAEQLAEQFPKWNGNMGYEITLEDSWEYSCYALSLNYRVAEPIMGTGFLDLMAEEEIVNVLRATIAFPDVIEILKKNVNDSPVAVDVMPST